MATIVMVTVKRIIRVMMMAFSCKDALADVILRTCTAFKAFSFMKGYWALWVCMYIPEGPSTSAIEESFQLGSGLGLIYGRFTADPYDMGVCLCLSL